MTFFIAVFILLMQFLWKYVDDFVGKGLEWYVIAQLMFYASATFVPLALPLAILLSSLMTFGNLGERYELTAMKAAGISLRSVMKPLIVVSIIISVVAFYFSNNVMPYANLKFKSLLYDVQAKKPTVNIQEGMYYSGIDGFVIKIGKKDRDGKTIHNVIIYNHTKRMGNNNLTIAKSGKMELSNDNRFLVFTLFDGANYDEDISTPMNMIKRPMLRTMFKEEKRRFDLSAFAMSKTNEDLFKGHFQMLNIKQLSLTEDTLLMDLNARKEDFYKTSVSKFWALNSQYDSTYKVRLDTLPKLHGNFADNFIGDNKARIVNIALQNVRGTMGDIDYFNIEFKDKEEYIRRYDIEWHRKFTLSIACLILFFIGAPLGAIIRKGGFGLPVVLSVLFFVIFHIISIIGEKVSREGTLDASKGMWIASAVLLPIGVFLTYKATTDSQLLDSDVWLRKFKRFINRKK